MSRDLSAIWHTALLINFLAWRLYSWLLSKTVEAYLVHVEIFVDILKTYWFVFIKKYEVDVVSLF